MPRVVFGGFWSRSPPYSQVADRGWHTAGFRNYSLGLRLGRKPMQRMEKTCRPAR